MRILHISSARDFGGGERHFRDLTRGLIGRGHDVFAALRPTNTWERHLDFLPKERVLHTSIRNSFGILSSKRIAGFVRENDIQIIHAHVARDYIPASVACLLANSAKFILTRHVLFGLKPFNKFALKNLSKAIAVSSGVEAELKRVFPAEKVAVIPHGIDMTVPAAGDRARLREEFRLFHQIPLDALVVGILGELIELKGQREFILAANEIVKQFPDARFVVVGVDHSIDQRFRRDLKRLAKTLDMDERFLWLDWLDDTEPFYCALDLLFPPLTLKASVLLFWKQWRQARRSSRPRQQEQLNCFATVNFSFRSMTRFALPVLLLQCSAMGRAASRSETNWQHERRRIIPASG